MLQHALAAQPRQDDSRSIKCSRQRCRLLQQPSPMQGVRSPMGCVRAQADCWPILTKAALPLTAIQAAILQVYLPYHDSHKARNSTELLVRSWVRQACNHNSPSPAQHTPSSTYCPPCAARRRYSFRYETKSYGHLASEPQLLVPLVTQCHDPGPTGPRPATLLSSPQPHPQIQCFDSTSSCTCSVNVQPQRYTHTHADTAQLGPETGVLPSTLRDGALRSHMHGCMVQNWAMHAPGKACNAPSVCGRGAPANAPRLERPALKQALSAQSLEVKCTMLPKLKHSILNSNCRSSIATTAEPRRTHIPNAGCSSLTQASSTCQGNGTHGPQMQAAAAERTEPLI